MPFPFSRTCCFPASVWALCCPYLVDSDVASSRGKPRRDMRSGRQLPYRSAQSAGGGEGFSPALLARSAARTEKSLSSRGTGLGRFRPLAVLRHRPGSSGYRTGTAPCQAAEIGHERERGNCSVFPSSNRTSRKLPRSLPDCKWRCSARDGDAGGDGFETDTATPVGTECRGRRRFFSVPFGAKRREDGKKLVLTRHGGWCWSGGVGASASFRLA